MSQLIGLLITYPARRWLATSEPCRPGDQPARLTFVGDVD